MGFIRLDHKILLTLAMLMLVGCGKASFDPGKPVSGQQENPTITGTLKVTSNNVADGITAALVTIEVKNMQGLPVVGLSLSLTVSGSDNVIVPCTKTDVNGLSRCKVYSTRAERKTISVTGSMIQSTTTTSLNLWAEALFMAPKAMRSAFAIVSSADVQVLPSGEKIIATSGIVETVTAQWIGAGKMQAHTSILGSIISDK